MADDPECFGNYNKINSFERDENDCLHCPALGNCRDMPGISLAGKKFSWHEIGAACSRACIGDDDQINLKAFLAQIAAKRARR